MLLRFLNDDLSNSEMANKTFLIDLQQKLIKAVTYSKNRWNLL